MTDQLHHRGPDDGRGWVDATIGIALGHRRLSIVDLSPEGAQPMSSPSERYIVVFNGEIYNHRELRHELASSYRFRGHSDTEVLLAACEKWGFQASLDKFVGMFAIALWDRHERRLYLARDRMGEKPLYYGWVGKTFVFGSELKALRLHPDWNCGIDHNSLAQYFRHIYIPDPHSIYTGIKKLEPGTWLSVDPSKPGHLSTPVVYWSVRDAACSGKADQFRGTAADAIERLDALIRQAVAGQMVADVPVGAFLSGGIDSSLIVGVMQSLSSRPVKTFTIGFDEREFNEAESAREVARHLGTEHTEWYIAPRDAMDVIPDMARLYDEPFADASQIPTFLVSKLAQKHVTVSLSGDGGDELFAGYNRYYLGRRIQQLVGWLPEGIRASTGKVMHALPSGLLGSILKVVERWGVRHTVSHWTMDERIRRIAKMLQAPGKYGFYREVVSNWDQPAQLVVGSAEATSVYSEMNVAGPQTELLDFMTLVDSLMYLPGDILVKVDRAAMGVSLETRVPLLDHRIVEFSWRVPNMWKAREDQGKWILRQVLYKYVPKVLVDRPKQGFGVPVGDWICGPLRDWAESLLDEKLLREQGLLNASLVRSTWEGHLSGRNLRPSRMWAVLMFQSWLQDVTAPLPAAAAGHR